MIEPALDTVSKERPILFSGAMVRAILAGTKTQTRRPVKTDADRYEGLVTGTVPQERDHLGTYCFFRDDAGESVYVHCPYGGAGDRLWVRENGWERPERTPQMMREGADTWKPYYFDADISDADHEQLREWGFKRRPSIHMSRRFCRAVLEITRIRVERLQDITEDDAKAEGAEPFVSGQDAAGSLRTHRTGFVHLWQSINGTWLENPWVWVVEFQRA